jgi:hypothetical protein
MFDIDQIFDMDGRSYGVLPDVSRGDAPMQPTTATGNGYGYNVSGLLDTLGGTLQSAVQYAILRDQQKIAQQTGYIGAQAGPVMPTPQAAASMANTKLLLLGALGIGLVFAMRGGK